MAGLINATALNPNVVGTLHFLLTKAPEKLRLPAVEFVTKKLGAELTEKVIKVLKWLTVIAVAKKINETLNDWAMNYWTRKARKADWQWSWEIAVVTGGCNGIGKEIVKGLLEKDIRVAVLDIAPLPADLANKRRCLWVKCDVTSPTSIAEAAKVVRAELGDPTILVNNAGVGSPHTIVEASNEWITKIFQINIISHFFLIKEFIPSMIKKNKGHIVGIASMASFVCPPGIIDYGSTKAAVLALHEGLTQEIKHIYKTPGVLNTIVHPSWVRTALVGGYEDHLEKTQGKLMTPEYIAKEVCKQVFTCRSGQIILPKLMSAAPGVRGHPNWIQEIVRDIAVGRKGFYEFPVVEGKK